MITTNLWRRLRQLTPEAPLLIGEVVAADTYGATLQLPTGALVQVRGAGTVGQKVFFRAGVIEGVAPDLPVIDIEI